MGKERTAKRGGFKGFKKVGVPMAPQMGGAGFVRWCKQMCQEDDACTSFQVESCLLKKEGACPVTDDTMCGLSNVKSTNEGAKVGYDASQTCFRNPATYQ